MEWFAPIEVTTHARERAAERLRWDDVGIARRIRVDVRLGLVAARCATVRPSWTVSLGLVPDRAADALYVWDVGYSRCWAIVPDGRRGVVTTLFLHGEEWSPDEERRHIRPGFRRPS